MVADLHTHEPIDQAILAFVDSLGRDELARFVRFQPKTLSHYLQCQGPWLEEEMASLGPQHGPDVSADELSRQILAGPYRMRYRAYYTLRYPDGVHATQE